MRANVLRNRLLLIAVYLCLLVQDRSSKLHGAKKPVVAKSGTNHTLGKGNKIFKSTTTTTTTAAPVKTELKEANKTIWNSNKTSKSTTTSTTTTAPFETELKEVYKTIENSSKTSKSTTTSTTTSAPVETELKEANETTESNYESATETTIAVPVKTEVTEADETIENESELPISTIQPPIIVPVTIAGATETTKTKGRNKNETLKSYVKISNDVPEEIVTAADYVTTERFDNLRQTALAETENVPEETLPDEPNGIHHDAVELTLGNSTDSASDNALEKASKTLENVVVEQFLLGKVNKKVSAKFLGRTTARNDVADDLAVETSELNRKIESIAINLMTFNAEGIDFYIPASEINIEKKKENETFTQRFVYVPKTFRLELPCSSAMASQSPFAYFQWFRNNVLLKLKGDRVKVGPNKELIFEELDPKDSGRYNCQRETMRATYTNIVDLHVFVTADVAVAFPFKFKAAFCNREEDLSIEGQIKEIFCHSFQSCSFDFVTTCHMTPWFGQENNPDPLPAILQVLVVKYTNPSYQSPICNAACVMKAKLDNILSEMLTLASAFKKVGESVRRVGHCTSSSCPSDYVFVPQETYTESTVLYVCDSGYVVHRISACVPCMPGEFSTTRGWSEDCEQCPVLTYQPDPGANSCIPCKKRTAKILVTGATSADVCTGKLAYPGKAFIGLICLIIILSILGVLIIVAMVMCSTSDAKEKPSQTPESSVAKGEKEPLQPGKKERASAGFGSSKAAAFSIGRKPTKASSLTSTAPQRPASSTAAQRRSNDLPTTGADGRRLPSFRTQPIKSAPSLGRDPRRASTVTKPSRSAAAAGPVKPESSGVTAAVHTQAATIPAAAAARGKVTEIEPLSPVSAKPVSATTLAPTAVKKVKPVVSFAGSGLGPESERITQTGDVSLSDTSYHTALSTTPVVSESRQTAQEATSLPTNTEPGLSTSAATKPPSLTPSAISQVPFRSPLASNATLVSETGLTSQATTSLPTNTASPLSSSAATKAPSLAPSAVSQASFKTPLWSNATLVSDTGQTPQTSTSLPTNTTSALSSSAATKAPALTPSAVSQASFTTPLWSNATLVSDTGQTPQTSTSLPTNTIVASDLKLSPQAATSLPTNTASALSSSATTKATSSAVSQVSLRSPLASNATLVSDTGQAPQAATSLPTNTASALSSSATSKAPVVAPSPVSQVSFRSPLASNATLVSDTGQTPQSTTSLPTNTTSALSSSATTKAPALTPSAVSQVSFRSPLASNATLVSDTGLSPQASTSLSTNTASAPSSSATTKASPVVAPATVAPTPPKVAATGPGMAPRTVIPAALSTVPTPSASTSATPTPATSMSAAVPEQKSQNINQSSRPHPSKSSWWSLGSASNDRPSAAQLPLTNDPHRKPLDRTSNIQLHVLRMRTEHEKKRPVGNSVSPDTRSIKTSKGSASNLMSSRVASPTLAGGERPHPSPLLSVETTPPAPTIGTESPHQNPTSQTASLAKGTASPLANKSTVNQNAQNSPLLGAEKNLELWNSYEATEMDNLVDGADDELVSEQALAVLGTKNRARKVLKR